MAKKSFSYRLFAVMALFVLATSAGPLFAADHGDAPTASLDRPADIGDLYAFLDPTDNDFVVLIGTTQGFIVPGEAVNFGIFDSTLTYRFSIENTGDPRVDTLIDVRFSRRMITAEAQTATISIGTNPPRRSTTVSFTAPATNPSVGAASPAVVVTALGTSGISFYAGESDDPFFFDIPGFARFVRSVLDGAPNAALLNRGRDSFAGYNTMVIALRVPVETLHGPDDANDVIGVQFSTLRGKQSNLVDGTIKSSGKPRQVDRAGNPGVNVALIPFPRKNAHNGASILDDSAGTFRDDILGTLMALGTNEMFQDVFLAVASNSGDLLRLDTGVANTGANPEAAFPNGRRLTDDVIDTLLFLVANGNALGDSVAANDVPLRDAFPFVGASQQPRDTGVVDDNTRN